MKGFTMKKNAFTMLIGVLMLVALIGCSDDNNPTNTLANFQPEIVNNTDSFEFQATDVADITGTVFYNWDNTGSIATINHSSTIDQGTAIVTVYDENYNQVYTSGLSASLNENTQQGTPGVWHVKVELTNMSGTLNFRLEKYTQTPM